MIEIGVPERRVVDAALAAPGGFAWWYVDLVTPEGDGAVLIWSFGLPFLPGYAASARGGSAVLPVARPSLNLVLYRRGRPQFYLLQEYASGDGHGSIAEQRLGSSDFVRREEGGRCTLHARLRFKVPGCGPEATGTLHLSGVMPRVGTPPSSAAPHVWTPIAAPATAELNLRLGSREWRLTGRAYHDANFGHAPLHGLGIERWMWGRVPLEGGERVYYLSWPEPGGTPVLFGAEMAEGGEMRVLPLEVELGPERLGFGGLRRPRHLRLTSGGAPWLEVTHREVADAGPFYLRLLSEAVTPAGERATGWSELCQPARVDLARHRPFVRMRVHRTTAPNSFWLPLFSGPREGRAARLLRHAAGRESP